MNLLYRVFELFEEIQDWDMALKDATHSPHSLADIFEIGQRMFHYPLALVDRHFNIVEHTQDLDLGFPDERRENGVKIPMEMVNELLLEPGFGGLETLDDVFSYPLETQEGRRICFNIHHGGQYVGRILANVSFIIVMLGFIFSKQLGDLVYVLPVISILVFIYTKTLTFKEVGAVLGSDMVLMTAGTLVISTGLANSGAGNLIGQLVLKILGSNPSSLTVITAFCVATTIMTTFLSNFGSLAVMVPIAVSTALAGGMNPKAVVLVVFCSSCLAIAFPTGSAAATFSFAVGNHNPIKLLKFTLPFLVIGMVSLIISAQLFFPVY